MGWSMRQSIGEQSWAGESLFTTGIGFNKVNEGHAMMLKGFPDRIGLLNPFIGSSHESL